MKRLLVALVLLFTLLSAGPAFAADEPDDRIVLSGPVLIDRDETAQDVVVLDGDVVVRGNRARRHHRRRWRRDDPRQRPRRRRDDLVTAMLGRRARIGGDLVYFDDKPVVSDGAKVSGETNKFDGGEIAGVGGAFALGFWLAVSLSLLVLGLLLLLLAPRAGDAIARTRKARWGASIGVGLLAIIVLPILAVVACISILGLPFGIGLLLALAPLYAIAYATAAFAIGRLILKNSRIPAFIVGLLILRLLALIPIVGGLFGLLAVIFGLGLLFVTLFRARSA